MKLHIDIDAFFVSAEQIRHKELAKRPCAVISLGDKEIFSSQKKIIKSPHKKTSKLGDSTPSSPRGIDANIFSKHDYLEYLETLDRSHDLEGVIIAKSYEAKAYGVKTAMSIKAALRLCEGLLLVRSNHSYYADLSKRLHEYLALALPVVEKYSIDEFFADLAGYKESDSEILEFARFLKHDIYERFSLPVSIGISESKWSAKFLTSMAKPSGVLLLHRDEILPCYGHVRCSSFAGVGARWAQYLRGRGVLLMRDVPDHRADFERLGLGGKKLYARLCGIDSEAVEPNRARKSMGVQRVFAPLGDREVLHGRLKVLVERLSFLLSLHELKPTRYALSLRYHGNIYVNKSVRSERIFSQMVALEIFRALLDSADTQDLSVLGLGLSCSGFVKEVASSLLSHERDLRLARLEVATTRLRAKYGQDIIM